jgi:hypothetical protein
LLAALDTISDRTHLDVLVNSELRVCLYKMHQDLTLKGPLRASISRDGVTVENGKAARLKKQGTVKQEQKYGGEYRLVRRVRLVRREESVRRTSRSTTIAQIPTSRATSAPPARARETS